MMDIEKKTPFKAKGTLFETFIPDNLSHRDDQMMMLTNILTNLLHTGQSSNIFCYGKTGTGKTVTTRYTADRIRFEGMKQNKNTTVVYTPAVEGTELDLYAHIGNETAGKNIIPSRGLSTQETYNRTKDILDSRNTRAIVIMEEIDKFYEKNGDDFLYQLSRINPQLKYSSLCLIGIANNLKFTEHFDPRVISSLNKEDIIFPPYNALQLQDILKQRAKIAFKTHAIEDGIINLCAALSAREHGDARRAIELLRAAGEIAEREGEEVVKIEHMKKAQNKIELDNVEEVIKTLPVQSKLILASIVFSSERGKNTLITGEVYDIYKDMAKKTGIDIITQRRATDLISELDMLGIINARLISYGRGGRTRVITPAISIPDTKELLLQDDSLSSLKDYKTPHPGRPRKGFF